MHTVLHTAEAFENECTPAGVGEKKGGVGGRVIYLSIYLQCTIYLPPSQ